MPGAPGPSDGFEGLLMAAIVQRKTIKRNPAEAALKRSLDGTPDGKIFALSTKDLVNHI